ncbi:GspE/PulE family protein [Ohtaekwangia koreensis]|uniref:Type IV pilus assembly protein PilB n=1 Tax=Ohtaekwangia koreensis TaxID=688867 RepID=A0A1T5K690_9BACT|nr:GspE/PulE family protein [Ohtaekwangia koreensis]SKC59257.1 type IV pilus assembly protein PilB [Ohtaekwangia koreensis]
MPNLSDITVDHETKKVISSDLAWHYRILPHRVTSDYLELFIEDSKSNKGLHDELEIVLGRKIKLISCEASTIEKALALHYVRNVTKTEDQRISKVEISQKDFVSELITEARLLKSSDIHIEIYEQKCRIRLRIDGKLAERIVLNKAEYPALINKIKIMAGMDISERRLPQDGRIFFNRSGLKFDIRVSVLPTLHGEKIVLRILGNNAAEINLSELGLSTVDYSRYSESIRKPNGIVLISGPTGSGKTTTLYATLKLLNKETDNILTVEDPIEYTLEGINQVQVKEDIGLSFSKALRTFLRQDPDVIMVGEIRDTETANLAIRAALTGHLVLSTIHTNSAWGTISRLIDMGIPSFLLANTLNATLAQRLVRLLCPHCKQKVFANEQIFPTSFKHKNVIKEHFIAKGCKECFFTGFKGRKAIYEVIPVDNHVSDFILSNAKNVSDYFRSQRIKTLQESALEVLINGETSIEEIYPFLLDEQY